MKTLKQCYKNGKALEIIKISYNRYFVRTRAGVNTILMNEFKTLEAAEAFLRFALL